MIPSTHIKNILAVVPEHLPEHYKIIIAGDFWYYNDGQNHSAGRICRINDIAAFDQSFNIGGTGADDNNIYAVAV